MGIMTVKMARGFESALQEATEKLITGKDPEVHLQDPFSGFYVTFEPTVERIIRETTIEGKKIYLSGGII
jgi:hypothetical protein